MLSRQRDANNAPDRNLAIPLRNSMLWADEREGNMALDPRMTLRPATLADVPLLDLWDRQPHVIAGSSDDPDQPKAFGDTYWPDELALTAPDNRYAIAELNGRPIGAMQIIDPCTERTHYWG